MDRQDMLQTVDPNPWAAAECNFLFSQGLAAALMFQFSKTVKF